DPLADLVVPARDVADRGQPEPSRRGQERHRHVGLGIRDDEGPTVLAHLLEEDAWHMAPRRQVPTSHRGVDDLPTRERPDESTVEKRDRMPRSHADAVKSVAKTVTD